MDWYAEVTFSADGEDETFDIEWVEADCGVQSPQATIEGKSLDTLGAKVGNDWKSFRELAERAADEDIDNIRSHHRADIRDWIADARYEAKRDREMGL